MDAIRNGIDNVNNAMASPIATGLSYILITVWLIVITLPVTQAKSIRDEGNLSLMYTKRWNTYRSFFRAFGLVALAVVCLVLAILFTSSGASRRDSRSFRLFAVAASFAAVAGVILTIRFVYGRRLKFLRRKVRRLERHTLDHMDIVTVREYVKIDDQGEVPTAVAAKMALMAAVKDHTARFERAVKEWILEAMALMRPPDEEGAAAPPPAGGELPAPEAVIEQLDKLIAEATVAEMSEEGGGDPTRKLELVRMREAMPDPEILRDAEIRACFTAVYINHMLVVDSRYSVGELRADLTLRELTRYNVLMSRSLYSSYATLSPQLTTTDGGILMDVPEDIVGEVMKKVATYNSMITKVVVLAGDGRLRVNHIVGFMLTLAVLSLLIAPTAVIGYVSYKKFVERREAMLAAQSSISGRVSRFLGF